MGWNRANSEELFMETPLPQTKVSFRLRASVFSVGIYWAFCGVLESKWNCNLENRRWGISALFAQFRRFVAQNHSIHSGICKRSRRDSRNLPNIGWIPGPGSPLACQLSCNYFSKAQVSIRHTCGLSDSRQAGQWLLTFREHVL